MDQAIRRLEEEIIRSGMNLYDFALVTEEGMREIHTQPCNPCNDSYSVTKAFVATAVGLLYDRGLLRLDEPILDILKEEAPVPADPGWRQVTVENALRHEMGIGCGYLDIDTEDIWTYGTTDFLEVLFRESLPYKPGTHYQYSDAAYYLLSRVVEARAGEPVDRLLMRKLFVPMRVREAAWSRCPMNHPIGATGLYMRASDMVKLGWLYVTGGVYEGRRILSEEWVRLEQERNLAFVPAGAGDLRGKGGMRGQMLLFSPGGRFAAAWHSFDPEKKGAFLPELLNRAMNEERGEF